VGGGVQFGPLGTAATNRPILPAPCDYDDGEIGGMIGKGNRSTQRKPAPVPLCPPQTPHVSRTRTRAAAVGSQRLTAWVTARPWLILYKVGRTPWTGMSPSQGRYLQTVQHKHRINDTDIHVTSRIRTQDPSYSSGGRRFMPQSARPISSQLK
jgi:hypothetical protein